ncbi:MAG TPA: hypothetical protein VEU33_03570, partial [Archangium sp.]|nr:hypothetical protein [Archangium sp.]
RLYGELTCDIGPQEGTSQETEARYGQLVPARVDSSPATATRTRYFVPSGYEGQRVRGGGSQPGGPDGEPLEEVRMGCGAAGGPVALLGLGLFASLLLRDGRAARARSLVVSRR